MARLVAVVVAALLVLSGCGDDSSASSPGASAATVDRPFRCPDPKSEPTAVVDHGGDSLPTGAEAALLCLHDNHEPWAPPRGALTSGLDQVVRAVNAQTVHDPDSPVACAGIGAPAWSMVFRYADGTRTITGDNGGCWDLLVGATEREGSQRVFDSYLQALVRQRAQEHPRPFHQAAPSCPARVRLPYYGPVSDATTARVGVACVLAAGSNRTSQRIPLTGAPLAILRHDLATASQRRIDSQEVPTCQGHSSVVLRGLDAWREPFEVDVTCGAYRFLRPAAVRYSFARMLPRTAHMVADLGRS